MRVADVFYSIQGEGALTGTPSIFIRASGCNLRCDWCDTPYTSWKPEGRNLSVSEILAAINQYPTRYCVLTGGEPMLFGEMWDLARALKKQGRHITIETNATVAPNGIPCDLASLSPKFENSTPPASKGRSIRANHEKMRINLSAIRSWIGNYDYQFKFVVSSAADIDEISDLVGRLNIAVPPQKIWLMPEDSLPRNAKFEGDFVTEACMVKGFRYCRRIHIDLFGHTRGT